MTITFLHERRNGDWIKVTIARSHTALRPALREQGTSSWVYKGITRPLVRRWHGELGKWRLLVQVRPHMPEVQKTVWTSRDHLEKSRRFQ